MFISTNPRVSGRQSVALGASLVLHGLLLAWLLYNPARFLAPSSVAKGDYGTAITPIYWRGPDRDAASAGVQKPTRAKLEWKAAGHPKPPDPARLAATDSDEQAAQSQAAPAGTPYGSSPTGLSSGDDIRPALPVTATDPVVEGPDLTGHGEGSVIVEITIDDKGNIVQKTVLQSLGPAVDAKVLAALESWHFTPATRNGVAIPSKQDVYYHFKPTG